MTQNAATNNIQKSSKTETVALVLEQGYSVPEAAKSLGIAANNCTSGKSFTNNTCFVPGHAGWQSAFYDCKARLPPITAVDLHLHSRVKA